MLLGESWGMWTADNRNRRAELKVRYIRKQNEIGITSTQRMVFEMTQQLLDPGLANTVCVLWTVPMN
jgi:hypothetical protein